MKVVQMKLADIEEADYNPRIEMEPGSPEWKNLEASLDEFGQVETLVWNERTGRLVGGHQRLRILRHRGDLSAWFSVVDLDEEREKTLNILLNNPEAQSKWDVTKLVDMTDQMSAEAVRLAGFNSHQDAHDLLLRAEMAGNTSFLGEFLRPEAMPDAPPADPVSDITPADGTTEPDEQRKPEHDLKEEHAHLAGPQYFEEKLVFDPEQREIYLRAIERLKRHHGVDNRFEALVLHLDEWNKAWDRQHIDAGLVES